MLLPTRRRRRRHTSDARCLWLQTILGIAGKETVGSSKGLQVVQWEVRCIAINLHRAGSHVDQPFSH
jgi:hypothetical protein